MKRLFSWILSYTRGMQTQFGIDSGRQVGQNGLAPCHCKKIQRARKTLALTAKQMGREYSTGIADPQPGMPHPHDRRPNALQNPLLPRIGCRAIIGLPCSLRVMDDNRRCGLTVNGRHAPRHSLSQPTSLHNITRAPHIPIARCGARAYNHHHRAAPRTVSPPRLVHRLSPGPTNPRPMRMRDNADSVP